MTILLPFFLFPMAILARNSFYTEDPSGLLLPMLTTENYLRLVTDSYYIVIFLNTLVIALTVGALALVISYPFAYYVVYLAKRSRRFLLWAVYTPLMVSVIVRVFGWIVITGDSGLINSALLAAGLITEPIQILFALPGMLIGLTHRYLPLMILPLFNSMAKIDPTLIKASAGLGASAARTQFRIVMPLAIPGAVAGFQLVFAGVLSDFVLPSLMGTTRFPMLAPAMYTEAVTNLSWATSAAMGLAMLVTVLAMLLTTNLTLRRLAPWARTL
jgi:ABC-type spermidine/putrescine transport system permease subunit I